MKKLLCIISGIAILLLMGIECRAADGKTHLNNGLRIYREEADFEGAISELQEAIKLGLDALRNATDIEFSPDNVEIARIPVKTKEFYRLSIDEVQAILNEDVTTKKT